MKPDREKDELPSNALPEPTTRKIIAVLLVVAAFAGAYAVSALF